MHFFPSSYSSNGELQCLIVCDNANTGCALTLHSERQPSRLQGFSTTYESASHPTHTPLPRSKLQLCGALSEVSSSGTWQLLRGRDTSPTSPFSELRGPLPFYSANPRAGNGSLKSWMSGLTQHRFLKSFLVFDTYITSSCIESLFGITYHGFEVLART